jgi:hypothetical protein
VIEPNFSNSSQVLYVHKQGLRMPWNTVRICESVQHAPRWDFVLQCVSILHACVLNRRFVRHSLIETLRVKHYLNPSKACWNDMHCGTKNLQFCKFFQHVCVCLKKEHKNVPAACKSMVYVFKAIFWMLKLMNLWLHHLHIMQ